MYRFGRRAVVVVLGAAALALIGAPAQAARPCRGLAAAAALPPYGTWLADVTEATAPASEHLADRLRGGLAEDTPRRPAVVLDIDNTALATGYGRDLRSLAATDPVLGLARQAKQDGAAVFFITARGESYRAMSRKNLETVGYPLDGLYLRPGNAGSVQKYKTDTRITIEQLGYTIVANIGNNTTDLAGGHAEYTVKLPDYNGLLG
jgi:hypothetical protein